MPAIVAPSAWARKVLVAATIAACRNVDADKKVQDAGIVAAPEPRAILGAHREPVPIPIVLDTSEGRVRCVVDHARAPRAGAMVLGLATGRAPFRDPASGAVVQRRYYDGLAFFRAIPDAMVQTGCPKNDGTGQPGYRIAVEAREGDRERLARPGAMFLARYQRPPNREDPSPPPPGEIIGSQIVVSLVDMSHLAGEVTVLGACEDLEVVRKISRRVASGDRVTLGRLDVRE